MPQPFYTDISQILHDPDRNPKRIWVKGNASLVDEIGNAITIAGAPNATSYGRQVASDLVGWINQQANTPHLIMTGGGATGVDGAALYASLLDSDTLPIAVVPFGLDHLDRTSDRLAHLTQVLNRGGLIISLEQPDSAPSLQANMYRLAWMGAMSAGTIIPELTEVDALKTPAYSAMLRTMPLGLVPGPITSQWSRGVHQLLALGYERSCLIHDAESLAGFCDMAWYPPPGEQVYRVDHSHGSDYWRAFGPEEAIDMHLDVFPETVVISARGMAMPTFDVHLHQE